MFLLCAERMTAPRTGFFYNFGRGELVARRWDPQQEDIGMNIEYPFYYMMYESRGLIIYRNFGWVK